MLLLSSPPISSASQAVVAWMKRSEIRGIWIPLRFIQATSYQIYSVMRN